MSIELPGEFSAFSILFIGFFLGLRHAIEADHLAAVSTIIVEKKNLLSASLVGGLWGLGHTISLFLAGVAVILLKMEISETLEVYFEAIVGCMLILLGSNTLRKLFAARKIHIHTHKHGILEHIHPHIHLVENETEHHGLSPRSVFIGMIHGLAGSAALMLMIIPTISSPWLAMLFILIFGIGSTGGMIVMSFLMANPLYFAQGSFGILNRGLHLVAGIFSVFLGITIVYEKLFARS
ncbi:MAG: urease accessory protein UreH [Blastocatellia bacterium]